jgi:hypothetical protein
MRGDGFLANDSLEHVIVFNEAALYRHVKSFLVYYHASRTHLALGQEAPEARPVQPLEHGPSLRYRKLVVFTTATSVAQPKRGSLRCNFYPGTRGRPIGKATNR